MNIDQLRNEIYSAIPTRSLILNQLIEHYLQWVGRSSSNDKADSLIKSVFPEAFDLINELKDGRVDVDAAQPILIFKIISEHLGFQPMLSLSEHGTSLMAYFEWDDEFDAANLSFKSGDYYKELQSLRVTLSIPEKLRYEHQLILAGSGHGKSYSILSMVQEDIERGHSLIVIDSQRDLINGNKEKGHKGIIDMVPEDRIVHIDPTDPTHVLAFNLLDSGMVEYLFSAVDAKLTSRQSMAYQYLSLLLDRIEGATIATMRDCLVKGGLDRYSNEIAQMNQSAQVFFNEFATREYTDTKQQLLRRILTILGDENLSRIFSSRETKIDLAEEINAGKVILIDTSKGDLDKAFSVFGRFWIAQILKAMRKDQIKRKTIMYIDESHEYFSDEEMMTEFFDQARKKEVGLVLSSLHLGKFPAGLKASVLTSTSIKMVGGVSAKDASEMARETRTDVETLNALTDRTFWAYFKGIGQIHWKPHLKNIPTHDSSRYERIRERMREKYYTPHTTPDVVIGAPDGEFDGLFDDMEDF